MAADRLLVALVPECRAAMDRQVQARLTPSQLRREHLGEQGVVAVPVAAAVLGKDGEAERAHLGQALLPGLHLQGGVAQRAGHPLQHGAAQEESHGPGRTARREPRRRSSRRRRPPHRRASTPAPTRPCWPSGRARRAADPSASPPSGAPAPSQPRGPATGLRRRAMQSVSPSSNARSSRPNRRSAPAPRGYPAATAPAGPWRGRSGTRPASARRGPTGSRAEVRTAPPGLGEVVHDQLQRVRAVARPALR